MEKLDRSSWGSGPWDNEPDYHEVRYRGYKIVLVRSNLGFWCSYIGIPTKSKWSTEEYYDQINTAWGVTWNETALPWGESEKDTFYIGFDYGHSSDYVPGISIPNSVHPAVMERLMCIAPHYLPTNKTNYKTMKHVIQDMKRVVKQIERE